MKLYKKLLKKPGETIGKIVDKAICYNTNNCEHKKAISQFCVITDEDQNVIKGFQITYDDFFKNNLFLNKENEKFYVSLELNLAADNPTTETAQESFPDINYRDGITHLGVCFIGSILLMKKYNMKNNNIKPPVI